MEDYRTQCQDHMNVELGKKDSIITQIQSERASLKRELKEECRMNQVLRGTRNAQSQDSQAGSHIDAIVGNRTKTTEKLEKAQ